MHKTSRAEFFNIFPSQVDNSLPAWDLPLLHRSGVALVFINKARHEMKTAYFKEQLILN